MDNNIILEAKGLYKTYLKHGAAALDNVNIEIPLGRLVGLLGPNGSGKTTLIKIANGLLTPTAGELLIGGMKPSADTKMIVSYLPDRDILPGWMTVEKALPSCAKVESLCKFCCHFLVTFSNYCHHAKI
ncbi:MAG: ATP-binding cassette domain-containing protein [Clostridia bacterium]|nr:ATP-binding cassette domain-containing protein [Clostridia bacterium]